MSRYIGRFFIYPCHTHYGDFVPRRNHKPVRKSKKPRPQRDPKVLERADPTALDSRLLADLAKRHTPSDTGPSQGTQGP